MAQACAIVLLAGIWWHRLQPVCLCVAHALTSGPRSIIHPRGDVGTPRKGVDMKTKRSHPYRITKHEAKKAWRILSGSGRMIDRLKELLLIKTGKGDHRIGQGFRNDITRIIRAAEEQS